jgi:hypothetical protein
MKQYGLFITIMLLLISSSVYSKNTQRGLYQKVKYSDGPKVSWTLSEQEWIDTTYVIEADIIETPGEILTTGKAIKGQIHVPYEKLRLCAPLDMTETMPLDCFVYVQLGEFPTQWQPGNHLRFKVTEIATSKTELFNITIPRGKHEIIVRTPHYIISGKTDVVEILDPKLGPCVRYAPAYIRELSQKIGFKDEEIPADFISNFMKPDANYVIEADLIETEGGIITTGKSENEKQTADKGILGFKTKTYEDSVSKSTNNIYLFFYLNYFWPVLKTGNHIRFTVYKKDVPEEKATIVIEIPDGDKSFTIDEPVFIIP